ncbi:hypothetical protein JCM10213_001517 [Rhodosporidiobolus nylandii]
MDAQHGLETPYERSLDRPGVAVGPFTGCGSRMDDDEDEKPDVEDALQSGRPNAPQRKELKKEVKDEAGDLGGVVGEDGEDGRLSLSRETRPTAPEFAERSKEEQQAASVEHQAVQRRAEVNGSVHRRQKARPPSPVDTHRRSSRLAARNQGRLPPEIVQHIFSYLEGDLATLERCSLVCRAFLHFARTLLYRYQSFDIGTDYIGGSWAVVGPPYLRPYAHLLSRNPHLAKYVRKLDFTVSWLDFEDDNETTREWMQYLDIDPEQNDAYDVFMDALVAVLPDEVLSHCDSQEGPITLVKLFPHVETVDVELGQGCSDASWLFDTLSSFPRLRTLRIRTWMGAVVDQPMYEMDLSTAFPALQVLSIPLHPENEERAELEAWCARRGIDLQLKLIK